MQNSTEFFPAEMLRIQIEPGLKSSPLRLASPSDHFSAQDRHGFGLLFLWPQFDTGLDR